MTASYIPLTEEELQMTGWEKYCDLKLVIYRTDMGYLVSPRFANGKATSKETWDLLVEYANAFYSEVSDSWFWWQHCLIDQLKWMDLGLDIPEPSLAPPSRKKEWNPGWVYVLKAGPYYKIGRSKNISKRIAQLATLPPFELETIHVIKANNTLQLESALHERFVEKRKNGEWFELTDEDVAWLKTL